MEGFNDCQSLADAYLACLASDERQAAEDAEPLSREWFRVNGNDVGAIVVCRDGVEYEIEAACGEPCIGVDVTLYEGGKMQVIMTLRHVTTSGSLRHLLSALGVKGGA